MNQSIYSSAFRAIGLLRESKVGMVGAGICLFWLFIALFADVLAPFDPVSSLLPMQKPLADNPAGGVFWLGTDLLGRDILSRIIYGTQTVLIYAPLATFSAYLVGIVMGLAGGYYQGRVDTLLSFLANVILSFPVLVLYILIIASIGASGLNIVLAVTFASAPGIFRIVRGLAMDLRNREYVAAAQTRGESGLWIMFVEILPNARGPLIVDACLRMGYVTITIGVLGFLGMGLPPPTPDWGGMISEARKLFPVFPHMAIFPCIAISSLVLGLNMLSDGLREISLKD
ncbi:ABC transporter permease [Pseudomonas benzenivorans]|uniref:ABC transporter permease n=1 Tax=Pseudomonas benzenivorans TaxID=556533 RepID=A0ABY5HA78_9PSED|nr:ABC transporter permease [Pseudomonas benzenivorans]UTW09240.1 ABC transporter permease [Pseudomonas benzenivorans]